MIGYNPRALKIRRALPAILLLAFAAIAPAARLSPLAERPDWSSLDKYQESITREDFLFLLDSVYAPGGGWKPFIAVGERSALIQTSRGTPPFVLRFAPTQGTIKPAPRFWRQKSQMGARPEGKPLAGVRIALDPGHLGGPWAKMEERWFQIGNAPPITEGDMTLLVARLLVPRLQALGAEVFLTRRKAGPVTPLRPDRLRKEAAFSLADKEEPITPAALKTESERLFYRVSEIHRRADLINEDIRPDLVLCLHFNAEAWGDPAHPTLTDKNHMHLLITGCFAGKELVYDDERYTMLQKLLSRTYREELALSESIADSLARATGLPPYAYKTDSAIQVGSSPYVWARNLLANRLFQCPVIYVEPYVMNSRAVFDRVQAGDFDGKRAVAGRMQQSVFREYADGVARGLARYYSTNP
ncbi:MAG: N-acetylmuramoyl-L-alanine amidase [Terrimicrobiaceae bacterium]|nr:N-acetylmuramoyl-L-alanine amidase [Terrimicrobiaceae bacterium]